MFPSVSYSEEGKTRGLPWGMYWLRVYHDVDIEFSLDFLAVFVVAGVLDIFGVPVWFVFVSSRLMTASVRE